MRSPNPGKSAARASWIAPILVYAVGYLLIHDDTDRATATGILGVQVVLVLVGLGAALYALFKLKAFGWRGILIPASIGLVLNAGYAALLGILLYLQFTPAA